MMGSISDFAFPLSSNTQTGDTPGLNRGTRGEAVGLGGKSGWRGVCRKRKEGESEDWIG